MHRFGAVPQKAGTRDPPAQVKSVSPTLPKLNPLLQAPQTHHSKGHQDSSGRSPAKRAGAVPHPSPTYALLADIAMFLLQAAPVIPASREERR